MELVNGKSIGKQLLNTLNGFIEYKLRAKEAERRSIGSSKDKGGFGARKRRKLRRTEAARRRSTPQSPTPPAHSAPPPPTQSCGRCQLLCTCRPPPSSLPSSALATPEDDGLPNMELVSRTDNLIFSQMIDLDKLVSGALGVRAEREVNMKNIIVKVTELIKENVDMGNILKELAGKKLQPRESCARQHIPVAMASKSPGQHIPVARANKPPGQDKATAMSEANIPVAKASRLQSQTFSNKNNSDFSGRDWFWGEIPLQKA